MGVGMRKVDWRHLACRAGRGQLHCSSVGRGRWTMGLHKACPTVFNSVEFEKCIHVEWADTPEQGARCGL